MNLTKDQRHTAYIIMLEEIRYDPNNKERTRLCHLIFKLFGISSSGLDEHWDGGWFLDTPGSNSIICALSYFPELHEKYSAIKFLGSKRKHFEIRKELLKQCIEETADF